MSTLKKVLCIVFVLIVLIASISYLYNKPANDIDIKLSTVVKPADLENGDYYYFIAYGDNYEEKSGYNVYNFYLNVENNSDYDIYNIHMSPKMTDDYILNHYMINDFDKFDIPSGNTVVVPLTICFKNTLTESEMKDIMNNIHKLLIIDLVDPAEEDPVNYSKTVIDSYDITDEDYSKDCTQYPSAFF